MKNIEWNLKDCERVDTQCSGEQEIITFTPLRRSALLRLSQMEGLSY